MQEDDFTRLEGIVIANHYSNRTDQDFPHAYVSFRTDKNPSQIYFLLGQNKPPIQNGQNAEGTAYLRNLSHQEQQIWVVDSLVLWDREHKNILAQYDFK